MKQKKSGSARRIVCLVLAAVMLLGLVSSALIIMVNAASSSEIKKELSGLRNQQAELKKEREALQAKIKEQGVREAAKEITQLTDEKLLDAIGAEYEKLA